LSERVAWHVACDATDIVTRWKDPGERVPSRRSQSSPPGVTKIFVEFYKLPTTGASAWARGRLAEELAPIDLPGALNLLKGTDEARDHDEYLGKMARKLAGKNPPEAARVLMMMRDDWPHSRDEAAQPRGRRPDPERIR
jgi:hypothetical protein